MFGEEERREIYGQAQILVQENLPFIYLVNPLSMGAVRNTIEGTRFSAIGGMFWNLPELRIEE